MHIKEITINHYKSIKAPIHLREFSGFHILVGPNNAGKTNILDAIHLFFAPVLEKERFFDAGTDIELTLSWKNNQYRLHCLPGKKLKILGKEKLPSKITLEKHFVRINQNINYSSVAHNLDGFRKQFPQEYENFSSALKKYFKDVEISEDLFLTNVYADNKTRPIQRMGEGFKRLFAILFYIFHPQYTIILIDEPEMHLHPSIIQKFLYALEEKRIRKQIFFTTHHPTLVQAKHFPRTWRIARNEKNGTTLYAFSREEVNINRLTQELNDDNSGMLFADKVLLVEGISDCLFMRRIIDRFYRKSKDIKVVYTGGKGSIDLYANLCETFSIPYAVMLDKDALYSASLERINKFPPFSKKTSLKEKVQKLKEKEIFILEKDLEQIYPSRIKDKETKPLTALAASQKITEEDLQSSSMIIIKELLDRI